MTKDISRSHTAAIQVGKFTLGINDSILFLTLTWPFHCFFPALRIRPLTNQDRAQPRFASLSEDDVLEVHEDSVHVIPHNKTFHFDHVFRPSCSQAEIFSTVGDALVHKFVDGKCRCTFYWGEKQMLTWPHLIGYNATILAYVSIHIYHMHCPYWWSCYIRDKHLQERLIP